MGLPTKGSRSIALGDTAYRWIVSAHQGYLRLIVELFGESETQMIEADFSRIERRLGITLPAEYRQVMATEGPKLRSLALDCRRDIDSLETVFLTADHLIDHNVSELTNRDNPVSPLIYWQAIVSGASHLDFLGQTLPQYLAAWGPTGSATCALERQADRTNLGWLDTGRAFQPCDLGCNFGRHGVLVPRTV